jgi:urocanate hydratase
MKVFALPLKLKNGEFEKRLETKYLDLLIENIDEAIDKALEAKKNKQAISIGVVCNAVHLLEKLVKRNIVPDTLTDQTSAHDPLIGYWPHEISYEEAKELRAKDPSKYLDFAGRSMYRHVELMLELMNMGSITFDYGNNIRARAAERGLKNAFAFPGFVPAYIAHCSAKAKARSDGRLLVAIPRILP